VEEKLKFRHRSPEEKNPPVKRRISEASLTLQIRPFRRLASKTAYIFCLDNGGSSGEGYRQGEAWAAPAFTLQL
jgi:hypothetical protein